MAPRFIQQSSITYNQALGGLAGAGGSDGDGIGGGLYNIGGMTTLTAVTISGNSANNGGGLANAGGSTTLTNCTVSGNSANNGGGLYNNDPGMITLADCTVTGNSAGNDGGGIDNAGGTVTLGNTIVAGNTATTSGPDAFGTFASQGNNLIGESDSSSGWVGSDLTGTIAQPLNPLLAPLEYYGGPTETMALLTGSPAIDAGNNALIPAGVTTDQRGFARVVNGTVDIGAYEVQSVALVFNTTTDGGGCPLGELDLRRRDRPGQYPARSTNNHLRPDRLRHTPDDHVDSRPARAEQHDRDGNDHRPVGGRDDQRRPAEPGIPGR